MLTKNMSNLVCVSTCVIIVDDVEARLKSVHDYIVSVERGCNDVYLLDERLMVNLEGKL